MMGLGMRSMNSAILQVLHHLAGIRMRWVKPEHFRCFTYGRIEVTLFNKKRCEVTPSIQVIRRHPQSRLIFLSRFRQFSLSNENVTQVVMRTGVARIAPNHFGKLHSGFIQLSRFGELDSEAVV